MKIAVCLGNVPDTTTKIRFADNNSRLDTAGIQWIINPWDELALTRALELRENPSLGIEKLTVLHVGGKESEPTIRKALAIGADDAVRIDAVPGDACYIASQLAGAIQSAGYDIILCGIESCDYNNSAVGGMLAEMLGYNSVSAVSRLEVEGGKLVIHREIAGGYEVIHLSAPAVLIVQKGIAKEPRIPSMRGIMMSKTKPLQVMNALEAEVLTEYVGFELPQGKAACKFIDPGQVSTLVELLHKEAKVI